MSSMRGSAAMTITNSYSSGHLHAMADTIKKLNRAQGTNNNHPHKVDMNYREVSSSREEEASPLTDTNYDIIDPDSPTARDIQFKYDDDRIQNDLLDEICSDIGIKDSMDLDFFDFDTNPGHEIRIQGAEDSLDETIVFSDLPELDSDLLDFGSSIKQSHPAQVTSTSDLPVSDQQKIDAQNGVRAAALQAGGMPYQKPSGGRENHHIKAEGGYRNQGSPSLLAQPDSSVRSPQVKQEGQYNQAGQRLHPVTRQGSLNSIDSVGSHTDIRNPPSVQSLNGSDSLPGSPAVNSPAMQGFLNEGCKTPTKSSVGKEARQATSSLGSPQVSSSAHAEQGLDSPANRTLTSDSFPLSPHVPGKHMPHSEHNSDVFKKPFSKSTRTVPPGYPNHIDLTGDRLDPTGSNLQKKPSQYQRSTSSPLGTVQRQHGLHPGNQCQGRANNLQRVHELSNSAPCLANDEALLECQRSRPGSHGPPGVYDPETGALMGNNLPMNAVPSVSSRSLDSPCDTGYFSSSTPSIHTGGASVYSSNTSLSSAAQSYGSSFDGSDKMQMQTPSDPSQPFPTNPLGSQFRSGTDLVNQMRQRFAPVFGVNDAGQTSQMGPASNGMASAEGAAPYGNMPNGAVHGNHGNMKPVAGQMQPGFQTQMQDPHVDPLGNQRNMQKILPGPTQMNRMEYSPYARTTPGMGYKEDGCMVDQQGMPQGQPSNFGGQNYMTPHGSPAMGSAYNNTPQNVPMQQPQHMQNGNRSLMGGEAQASPLANNAHDMHPGMAPMQRVHPGGMSQQAVMQQQQRYGGQQQQTQGAPGMQQYQSRGMTGSPNTVPLMHPGMNSPNFNSQQGMNQSQYPAQSRTQMNNPNPPQVQRVPPSQGMMGMNSVQHQNGSMGGRTGGGYGFGDQNVPPQGNMQPNQNMQGMYRQNQMPMNNQMQPNMSTPQGQTGLGMSELNPDGTPKFPQNGAPRPHITPQQGFIQRLVMSDGSSAFRSHPLFPLLRDLIIADMNFHTPNFPFQLISNLPTDFNRLLQNYLNRNPPASNYQANEAVEGVIMDALKYAHSTLIEKIDQRKVQSQNQDLPKHLCAIEDFCDRFDKAVRNTMVPTPPNQVPQSHYGAVAGATIPIPQMTGSAPNRNPVAPPTPKKRRGELMPDFSSPLKGGSDSSCPGTPSSTKSEGKGKKHPVLPKEAVSIMLEWLKEHKDNPYPNDNEKQMLIQKTKLTINQINYWFTNARRRILPKWALQQYMEQQGYPEHT